jgi:hypothetical protein
MKNLWLVFPLLFLASCQSAPEKPSIGFGAAENPAAERIMMDAVREFTEGDYPACIETCQKMKKLDPPANSDYLRQAEQTIIYVRLKMKWKACHQQLEREPQDPQSQQCVKEEAEYQKRASQGPL